MKSFLFVNVMRDISKKKEKNEVEEVVSKKKGG